MSFALNVSSVPYVMSYPDALALWERAPQQSRSGVGERKIPGHMRPITGLSRYRDDIHFTYHTTDVAVWSPDGSCRLDLRYTSRSTAAFAHRFTPAGVNVHNEADLLSTPKGYIRGGGVLTFRADGSIEGMRPFRHRLLDRKAARKALQDEGVIPFSKWYAAQRNFWPPEALHRGEPRPFPELLQMMRDESRWPELLSAYVHRAGNLWDTVRQTIYERHHAYYYEEQYYAPEYNAARKWLRG